MPNTAVPAAGGAMPAVLTSRRSLLVALTATPAIVVPLVAVNAAQGDDAELYALEAEIRRLHQAIDEITSSRITPFDEEWVSLLRPAEPVWERMGLEPRVAVESLEAANAFIESSRRRAAIEQVEELYKPLHRMLEKLIDTPARTQEGRVLKVSSLIQFVLHSPAQDWRGPDSELDWDCSLTRRLLGEYAGLTEAELAAI